MTREDEAVRSIASWRRSAVKAASYRILIVCLDSTVIYLLTGKARLAFGFMIISNIYTTVGYFIHERVWTHIKWGMDPAA